MVLFEHLAAMVDPVKNWKLIDIFQCHFLHVWASWSPGWTWLLTLLLYLRFRYLLADNSSNMFSCEVFVLNVLNSLHFTHPCYWCSVEGLYISLIGRLIIPHLFLPQDTRTTDFDWSWLFAPFPYGARYKCFLRIVLSAPMAEELRDWVGWVKSRFRNLLLKVISPFLKHVCFSFSHFWVVVY